MTDEKLFVEPEWGLFYIEGMMLVAGGRIERVEYCQYLQLPPTDDVLLC